MHHTRQQRHPLLVTCSRAHWGSPASARARLKVRFYRPRKGFGWVYFVSFSSCLFREGALNSPIGKTASGLAPIEYRLSANNDLLQARRRQRPRRRRLRITITNEARQNWAQKKRLIRVLARKQPAGLIPVLLLLESAASVE